MHGETPPVIGTKKPFFQFEGSSQMEPRTMEQSAKGKRPLTVAQRRRLAVYVDKIGEKAALDALRIGRPTLSRALAGQDLRLGSIALIESAIGEGGAS
jgi:hypothetical protein